MPALDAGKRGLEGRCSPPVLSSPPEVGPCLHHPQPCSHQWYHPPGRTGGLGISHHSQVQQRLITDRKWRLGVHARGHPSALMLELYRVLLVGVGCWGGGGGGVLRLVGFSGVAGFDCF